MSNKKLLLIKKYLQKHFNKKFIESNTILYAFFILFAKKFNDNLRFFCVDYRKLNVIIKKNKYLIFLIVETIAWLFKTRWTIKIDIQHAFNQIWMHLKKNENSITFKTKYEIYKYLIMLFNWTNDLLIFQNFINDILMNYLNNFVITYLNNIIMYNNTKKIITYNMFERFFNVCEK